MRPHIDIEGVGRFHLETGEGYHLYRAEIPGASGETIEVIVYPEEDEVDEAYADHAKRTTAHVIANLRTMLEAAEPQIREVMEAYGEEPPEDFPALVQELRLTHIKISEDDDTEIICAPSSAFPDFDLNATLDDGGRIVETWFDG